MYFHQKYENSWLFLPSHCQIQNITPWRLNEKCFCAHPKLMLCWEHRYIKRFPKLILLHFVLLVCGLVEVCYCCWCHSNFGFSFYFYTGSILTQQGFLVTVFCCGSLDDNDSKHSPYVKGLGCFAYGRVCTSKGRKWVLGCVVPKPLIGVRGMNPHPQSEPGIINPVREKADQKQTLWRQGS